MGKNAHVNIIWAEMPVVLALFRAGTLADAAISLGLDRTTVGRRLKALEHALGARLFERQHGRYQITALGREVLSAAEAAELELAALQSLMPEQNDSPGGSLKITTTPHLLPMLATAIITLATRHGLMVTIASHYDFADLEARKADIAVRIMKSAPAHPLVGRKIKRLRGAMYRPALMATPDRELPYIAREYEDQIPDYAKPWLTGRLMIRPDNTSSQQELIAAGGIGRLPVFVGDNDPRLSRLSDLLPDEGWQLWLVSHAALSRSPRIITAMNVLATHINTLKNL